jgi:hypothetical protein
MATLSYDSPAAARSAVCVRRTPLFEHVKMAHNPFEDFCTPPSRESMTSYYSVDSQPS